jgi:hypothetical protein
MADLLRQRLVGDGLAWTVATAWDARAARVCCGRGVPSGEVVRLPGGTVSLQAAADWTAAMVLGTICSASPLWQSEQVTRAAH